MFARILDDITLSNFRSTVSQNNLSIVLSLQALPNYMFDLFSIYKTLNNVAQKRDGVQLVYQFSLALKSHQHQQKRLTFEQMVSNGLLRLFDFALNDIDSYIRKLGTELLLTVIDIDPTLIHYDSSDEESLLLLTIAESTVNLFLRETDIDICSQLIETLQHMLSYDDSSNIMPEFFSSSDSSHELRSEAFISGFYDGCGKKLYAELIAVNEGEFMNRINQPMSLLKKGVYENLCRLLKFLMSAHRTKCFEFTIKNKVWKALSLMIKSRHQKLQLAALQCLKQALVVEDYTLCIHLTEHNIVEEVVDNLVKMGNKNNLVNSASLEILDMIASETLNPFANKNMILVLNHLIESRLTSLELINYTDLSAKLFESYKSNLQIAQTVDSTIIQHTGLLEDAMKPISSDETPIIYQYCTIEPDPNDSIFENCPVISNKRSRTDDLEDQKFNSDTENSPKLKKLYTENTFANYDANLTNINSPIRILSIGPDKDGLEYADDVIEFPKKEFVPISTDSPDSNEELSDSPPKVAITKSIPINTDTGFSTIDSKESSLISTDRACSVASRPRRKTISYSNGGPIISGSSIKKKDNTGLKNNVMSFVLSGIDKSRSIE